MVREKTSPVAIGTEPGKGTWPKPSQFKNTPWDFPETSERGMPLALVCWIDRKQVVGPPWSLLKRTCLRMSSCKGKQSQEMEDVCFQAFLWHLDSAMPESYFLDSWFCYLKNSIFQKPVTGRTWLIINSAAPGTFLTSPFLILRPSTNKQTAFFETSLGLVWCKKLFISDLENQKGNTSPWQR